MLAHALFNSLFFCLWYQGYFGFITTVQRGFWDCLLRNVLHIKIHEKYNGLCVGTGQKNKYTENEVGQT